MVWPFPPQIALKIYAGSPGQPTSQDWEVRSISGLLGFQEGPEGGLKQRKVAPYQGYRLKSESHEGESREKKSSPKVLF